METLKNMPLHQVSEIQLIYNPIVKPSKRPKVTTSIEVYKLFFNNWDLNKIELIEQFKIMLLNRAQKVLGIVNISTGGVTRTIADPCFASAPILIKYISNLLSILIQYSTKLFQLHSSKRFSYILSDEPNGTTANSYYNGYEYVHSKTNISLGQNPEAELRGILLIKGKSKPS